MSEPPLDPMGCDIFCPHCLSNLEDAYWDDTEKLYECTVCGGLTTEGAVLSRAEAKEQAAIERAEEKYDESFDRDSEL